jgi:phytoene synthase
MRPHVAAVYAFARIADDFADEGSAAPPIRREQLRRWQARLHEAVAGERETPGDDRYDQLFYALGHSIRSLDLPVTLFDDLLSAFCQDTTTTRYASWSDVLDYCRRSANPIGRLVLRIAGHRNQALDRSSDALCTALQLTNFWQDFGRDWRAGRLYVPRDIQQAAGADEAELADQIIAPSWVQALGLCVERTERLFEDGRAVCDGVGGRLMWELRLTWLGGRRILERVAAKRSRLLHHRPRLGAADAPWLLWHAVRWRRAA